MHDMWAPVTNSAFVIDMGRRTSLAKLPVRLDSFHTLHFLVFMTFVMRGPWLRMESLSAFVIDRIASYRYIFAPIFANQLA